VERLEPQKKLANVSATRFNRVASRTGHESAQMPLNLSAMRNSLGDAAHCPQTPYNKSQQIIAEKKRKL